MKLAVYIGFILLGTALVATALAPYMTPMLAVIFNLASNGLVAGVLYTVISRHQELLEMLGTHIRIDPNATPTEPPEEVEDLLERKDKNHPDTKP